MINEEEYNKDLLEELNIYEDIHKQPSRKKCATLGIEGIQDLVKQMKHLQKDKPFMSIEEYVNEVIKF